MNPFLSQTLSQIVNENHRAASVFEKYNLNYCCSGKRSLLEACNENSIPVNEVLEAIENIYSIGVSKPDFTCFTLYQLTDYIVHTHHSYINKETPQVLLRLQKAASQHGSGHPELYKISELFVELSNEVNHLMLQEETILFPRIKQLEQNGFEPIPFDHDISGYLELPIANLEYELTHIGKTLAKIKTLTNDYTAPLSTCTTFKILYGSLEALETDFHEHLHLENDILFPKALLLEKKLQLCFFN